LEPTETSVVEGVQLEAPAHVSATKTFCALPGISVDPSVEASTKTAKRWSWLISGNESGLLGMLLGGVVPGVNTANGSLLEVPPPQLTVALGVHSVAGSAGLDTVTGMFELAAVRLLTGITPAIALASTKMFTGSAVPLN